MSRTRYKAVIYAEKDDGKGNIALERVTTSQWVTVPMIAASVGLSFQTMYRHIVDNRAIPYFRFGSKIKVRVEDFVAWMEKCREAEYERPGER